MNRAPWAALGALAGLLVALVAWPGVVTFDAAAQLLQARLGMVNDLSPALLARGWRLCDRVWPGAGPPFLLGNLAFQGGVLLFVAARHGRSPRAGLLVLLVGLCPPVLAHLAQVGKDTVHAAALALTAGLLAQAEARGSLRLLGLAALAALLAAFSRHNGAIPLLPLAVWGALVARDLVRPGQAPRRWVLAGLGATVLITLLGLAGNRAATDRRVYIEQHLFLWDLAGIAVRSGELELPAHTGRPPLEAVRERYTPITCLTLSVWPWTAPLLRPTDDPAEVAQVRRAWLRAIRRHPLAWARHRLDVFRHLLGLYPGPNRSFQPVRWETHLLPAPGPLGLGLLRRLESWQNGLLCRPWTWALLGLALLVRGLRRGDRAVVALCSSGLLYLASYLVLAPAADLRYALWTIVAVALAGAASVPRAT